MVENATVRLDVLSDADFDLVERAFSDLERTIEQVKRNVVQNIKQVEVNVEQLQKQKEDAESAAGSAGVGDQKQNEQIVGPIRGIWRSFRSLNRTIGMMAGFVAKGVGLVTGALMAFHVLEQPIKMIGDITKMISMLLRPITDTMIMLIMPVFHMLRPIIQMVNTMMMPFREAAFTGLAAANALIAEGTQMSLGGDTELGGQLIGEGMKGAMHSASLMFSGFIEMIGQPIAETIGLGEQFSNAMASWQDSALGGIHRVIILNDTFQSLKIGLGDSAEAAENALAMIDEQMAILRASVGTFSIKNFKDDMELAKTIADGFASAALEGVDAFEELAEKLGTDVATLAGRLLTVQSLSMTVTQNMQTSLQAMDEMQRMQAAQAALARVQEKIDDGPEGRLSAFFSGMFDNLREQHFLERLLPSVSLVEQIKAGIGSVRDVKTNFAEETMQELNHIEGQLTEMFQGELPAGIRSGLEHMKEDMDEYMTRSLIPDGFRSGLEHMYTATQQGMTSISSTHNNALNSMSSATNSFGSQVNRVAGIVQDAVRRMEQYARQYHSALSRIQSLERQLRDRRND